MSKFSKAKAKFDALSDEDKAAALVGGIFVTFMAVLLLILIVALIKELLVPALVAGAVYGAGVKFFNWPIPKFAKKLFK
jgi:hypothetical protein